MANGASKAGDAERSHALGAAAGEGTLDALAIRGLVKFFGGTPALAGVDLGVKRGEVHALLGQNGSGKSTVVKILAGYHRADAGEAEVAGRPLALGNPIAAREAGIRFVHQDLALVDTLSTVENLALGRGFTTRAGTWISWRAEAAHARRAVDAIGYKFDVRRPVGELAASERVGVAVARALQGWMEEAHLLVLDEPTAALPAPEVRRIFEMVRHIRERGVSVIFISHRLEEVMQIADTVTVLRDGHVVGTHAASDLDNARLVQLIVGKALDVGTPSREHGERRDSVLTVRDLRGVVVDGVSFEVHCGEILGAAGITGSGREELARLLFGATVRQGGDVLVHGVRLPAGRPDAAARAMGFIPANRRLAALNGLTVRENLTLAGLTPYTSAGLLRRRKERKDARDWLTRVAVRPLAPEAQLWTLSGGNQQKVILGRWLKLRPHVLVLDEPTQGVDVSAKEQIYALIESASERGLAVLVCSSDTDELVRLCDRVLVFRRGRVAAELFGDVVEKTAIDHAALMVSEAKLEGLN